MASPKRPVPYATRRLSTGESREISEEIVD
ncbi:MAG: DUF5466 domain-containing protein [Bacteroidota bacterium]